MNEVATPLVDAHLDVAWNAIYNGRDLTRSVAEIRAQESAAGQAIAMTSLRDLSAAGVALVFATLYATPMASWANSGSAYPTARPIPRYRTPAEAEASALEMLSLYQKWERAGHIRMITDVESLDQHLRLFAGDRVPGLLLLMEGADPVLTPEDLPTWFDRGVRIIGLAWGSTRYAGGTGASTGLTGLGRELLAAMYELGIIHDASHLSEESFWEAAGLQQNGLCVTHASARSLMCSQGVRAALPLNRFLTDEQIVEVARRHGPARGVVGMGLLNCFLEPEWDAAGPPVKVDAQLRDHIGHIADLAGWESVGIGSDVDAGYGSDQTPDGIDTVADWVAVGDQVPAEARAGVLGGNWLRFLREALPHGQVSGEVADSTSPRSSSKKAKIETWK
jgi:membrane dipeptidase